MLKRIVAVALWFFSGWTLGAFLAWSIGSPDLLGPLLGIVAATAVAIAGRDAFAQRHEAVRS